MFRPRLRVSALLALLGGLLAGAAQGAPAALRGLRGPSQRPPPALPTLPVRTSSSGSTSSRSRSSSSGFRLALPNPFNFMAPPSPANESKKSPGETATATPRPKFLETTLFKVISDEECIQFRNEDYEPLTLWLSGFKEGTCESRGFGDADGTREIELPGIEQIPVTVFIKTGTIAAKIKDKLDEIQAYYKIAGGKCVEATLYPTQSFFFDDFKVGSCESLGFVQACGSDEMQDPSELLYTIGKVKVSFFQKPEQVPEKPLTVYKLTGDRCSQTDIEEDPEPLALFTSGFKEGTCAAAGFSEAFGSKTEKSIIFGDVTVKYFKKAGAAEADAVTVYKIQGGTCAETKVYMPLSLFFSSYTEGTCESQGFNIPTGTESIREPVLEPTSGERTPVRFFRKTGTAAEEAKFRAAEKEKARAAEAAAERLRKIQAEAQAEAARKAEAEAAAEAEKVRQAEEADAKTKAEEGAKAKAERDELEAKAKAERDELEANAKAEADAKAEAEKEAREEEEAILKAKRSINPTRWSYWQNKVASWASSRAEAKAAAAKAADEKAAAAAEKAAAERSAAQKAEADRLAAERAQTTATTANQRAEKQVEASKKSQEAALKAVKEAERETEAAAKLAEQERKAAKQAEELATAAAQEAEEEAARELAIAEEAKRKADAAFALAKEKEMRRSETQKLMSEALERSRAVQSATAEAEEAATQQALRAKKAGEAAKAAADAAKVKADFCKKVQGEAQQVADSANDAAARAASRAEEQSRAAENSAKEAAQAAEKAREEAAAAQKAEEAFNIKIAEEVAQNRPKRQGGTAGTDTGSGSLILLAPSTALSACFFCASALGTATLLATARVRSLGRTSAAHPALAAGRAVCSAPLLAA